MSNLRKVLKDYIYYIQYTEPKSSLTVEAYKNDLNDFITYLEEHDINDFKSITFDILLDYTSQLEQTFANTSQRRKISSLKSFYKYLSQYGIVDHNLTSFLQGKKKVERLPQTLSSDELKQLFSFPKEKLKDYLDYAILQVLFSTGIRVSECVDLIFSQIFFEERWLKIIGKGNKERMVPISKEAIRSLTYYLDIIRPQFEKNKMKHVFLSPKGQQITRQYIHTMIQYRQQQTGLNKVISAHTLRHSLATNMLNQSVDLRVIQEILGHSDIKTTQIYTQVDNQTLKKEYDSFLKGNFNEKGDGSNEI